MWRLPVYEYECEHCGVFELYRSITAEPLRQCPKCGGQVRKLISRGVSVIFKGSGFHTTDYRSEEYRKKEKEEKSQVKDSTAASS
ncbi:MAG: zinc ribbon domain-containing protein [Bacillota bacterium]|nr:zinc ribbon domain-containing protein [Bacillota bacterium]MDI7249950.1 zinc ribbon domain-containing protein [Bacillota bacterium]